MAGSTLASLRFPVERSCGRRFPELPHPYRNDFQRDRDRVVHARAFRRLEDKTQVFTPGVSDHFRNRLTHTIEVAQIARTVAGVLELDTDLTEALALAHDVGHPPFAHAGEDELDVQMRRHGHSFDHNLHSLRIVDSFEQRYARFPGLNLTFEVREGIVKHSRELTPGESPELDEFLPGLRPPLEAQLIDLCDEIAYNTADLDDAFSAQFFTIEQICAEVPKYCGLFEAVETQFSGASERLQFLESLRALIDYLVSGLIEGTFLSVTEARVDSLEAVREHPSRLVALSASAAETNSLLKKFLHSRVYDTAILQTERDRVRRMIAELFEFFLAKPDRLPDQYRDVEPLHRGVCDYIAGMTDGFFRRTHRQMIG